MCTYRTTLNECQASSPTFISKTKTTKQQQQQKSSVLQNTISLWTVSVLYKLNIFSFIGRIYETNYFNTFGQFPLVQSNHKGSTLKFGYLHNPYIIIKLLNIYYPTYLLVYIFIPSIGSVSSLDSHILQVVLNLNILLNRSNCFRIHIIQGWRVSLGTGGVAHLRLVCRKLVSERKSKSYFDRTLN